MCACVVSCEEPDFLLIIMFMFLFVNLANNFRTKKENRERSNRTFKTKVILEIGAIFAETRRERERVRERSLYIWVSVRVDSINCLSMEFMSVRD